MGAPRRPHVRPSPTRQRPARGLTGPVLAGLVGLLAIVGAVPGTAATGEPEDAPAVQPAAPSKLPALVLQRIEAIQATMRTAAARGVLSPQAVQDLSDDLLQVSPAGELLLEIHALGEVGLSEKDDVTARGARVVSSTGDLVWPAGIQPPSGLGIVEAWVPLARLGEIAALPWVAAVRPAERSPADVGGSLSEGVALHGADLVQTAGIDGTGVTVGVISDGVSSLAASVGTGDLPVGVTVINTGSGDEGTAMLEIVHDMAPGAALVFDATGSGVVSHVAAQNALVGAGVDVISEDIPFDGEPAFQKGAAAASGDVIAAAGVSVHSSAGNLGQAHSARVLATGTGGGPDGYAGSFTGCSVNPTNVVAIAPGNDTTFDVTLGKSTSFTLQWSEPRAIFPTPGAGGFTNLDLFIMDSTGTTCLAQSTAVQGNGSGDTIEQITTGVALNGTAAKIVVNVTGASGPRGIPTLDLRWRGASAVDTTTRAGSLNPDSNYTGPATSAAAADAGASTNPTTVALEGFSGGGPVQLFSTTVCPGSYPCSGSSVAGSSAVTVGAPTWTAADGVQVSGAGGFSSPFFGTSAAAPHAAACDALVRQHLDGGATVGAVSARLAATATDRNPPGFDNQWGAGVLSCRRAILPIARIGGPYATSEGTNLTLDASASSDPDGDALDFSWDLNNDGVFGDASGATPVFDTVGQDGAYPIAVRVTDPGGLSDTATGTVVVTNVVPAVTSLTSNAPRDENSPVAVSGVVSDPGWLDPLSASVDWGDGTTTLVLGTLENLRPDATLTFAAAHTYGDNGTFTATVCASDDDATRCRAIALAVGNVAPAAAIDTTGSIVINGQPTFVAHVGDSLPFSVHVQDPGSDDLKVAWDWDDGAPSPDVVTDHLVNPPNPDPFPSPTIQPRDLVDAQTHTFTAACLYQVGASATDDDGGSTSRSVMVLIAGAGGRLRPAGNWQHQLGRQGKTDFDEATLSCYVKMIGYGSTVFSEVRTADTIPAAYDVLFMKQNGGSESEKLDRELMTAWLNFANGAIAYGQSFDLNHDHVPDGTFASLVAAAETVRLNPASSDAALRAQTRILHALSTP